MFHIQSFYLMIIPFSLKKLKLMKLMLIILQEQNYYDTTTNIQTTQFQVVKIYMIHQSMFPSNDPIYSDGQPICYFSNDTVYVFSFDDDDSVEKMQHSLEHSSAILLFLTVHHNSCNYNLLMMCFKQMSKI